MGFAKKFDVFLFPGDFFLEGIHQQGSLLGIEQEGVVLQKIWWKQRESTKINGCKLRLQALL